MRARRTIILAVAVATAVALPAEAGAKKPPRARLASFGSCAQLVGYAQSHAVKIAQPGGLPTRVTAQPPVPIANGRPGTETTTGAPAPALADGGVTDFSDTNTQESGVNEPDIVKTDGKRLFAVSGSTLYAVDLTGAEPKVVGSLELGGYGQELLLRGDRLLAVSANGAIYAIGRPLPAAPGVPVAASILPGPVYGSTVLTEIDVGDPAHMSVRRTEEMDGFLVDARQHGKDVRVVVSAPPRVVPVPEIDTAGLRTWMPRKRFASRLTGRTFNRQAARCDDVRRPAQFSGLGMLTIATIDLERGLPVRDSEAILSDATTVYASQDSLYVATERWMDPDAPAGAVPQGRSTAVHRFALDGTQTRYRASGLVTGFLLNQFSMSERGDVLRVATTTDPPWWNGAGRDAQESIVTTLRERDGKLVEAGRLAGLGKGERIYAVRFFDDAAFVVTFRQVDPLFAIDLSDADHPRLAGQLDLLGYSSYLHPAGDGLLLGVGQSASASGRTEGTQLQLFDISDLSAPKRIAQARLGDHAYSEAEQDHHAFLFWPRTGLAVVPISDSGGSRALGFDARRAGGLKMLGQVGHPDGAQIRRSLVVGQRLLTVSDAGVRSSRLDTLADVAWAPFHS